MSDEKRPLLAAASKYERTPGYDTSKVMEAVGLDEHRREQVLAVDRGKVDEALDVVVLSESVEYETVFDKDESEYVRKAEVDTERKETRFRG